MDAARIVSLFQVTFDLLNISTRSILSTFSVISIPSTFSILSIEEEEKFFAAPSLHANLCLKSKGSEMWRVEDGDVVESCVKQQIPSGTSCAACSIQFFRFLDGIFTTKTDGKSYLSTTPLNRLFSLEFRRALLVGGLEHFKQLISFIGRYSVLVLCLT